MAAAASKQGTILGRLWKALLLNRSRRLKEATKRSWRKRPKSKGVAKNTLGTQCMKSSKRRLAQILPTYPPKNWPNGQKQWTNGHFLSVWVFFCPLVRFFAPKKTIGFQIWHIYLPTFGALCFQPIFCPPLDKRRNNFKTFTKKHKESLRYIITLKAHNPFQTHKPP